MNRRRRDIIAGNEISSLYEFELGGYKQKVLIEGRSKTLPVVLFLHGGPGTPIPFSVGCRGLFPEFTDRFIMVYWDQLGCGINNHAIDESFTIDTFVTMTIDLVKEVKQLFTNNKVHIFATSWGSILSAQIADKASDLIDGVVACGQIVKEVFLSDEVFEALEKSKLPVKKLERIKQIRRDGFEPKELQLISTSIRKYTNGYQNKNGKSAPMGSIVCGLLTSPDYCFKDFTAIMVNGYRNNVSLWKEILAIDLTDTLKRVQVPYMIVQGDTDIVASTRSVKELVEAAKKENSNTYLQYHIVENSGHMPGVEMMDTIFNMLSVQTGGIKPYEQ